MTWRARQGEEHLGDGWAFPIRWSLPTSPTDDGLPTRGGGRVARARGKQKVEQSIRTILATEIRSRVMRPEFGADVARYVFAENRPETCFRLQTDVERALLLWEPRIVVEQIEAVPAADDDARIDVLVSYRVDRQHRPESLVYPFYLDQRGTRGGS